MLRSVCEETIRLYYENAYMTEFTACVTGCEAEKDGGFVVTLDKTAFFPEGGGQPWDTGKIGDVTVTAVKECKQTGRLVLHYTDKPLEVGVEYACSINWERRFPLMQEHTGEHILSGVVKSMFGLQNIGFHMGAEFVTVDFDGVLNEEQLSAAERAANEAVFANIGIESMTKRGSELDGLSKKLPFRSKLDNLAQLNSVRIVHIDGYDACACCGVHCAKTGEIGVIKIVDFQKYKSGTRVFMLCGYRALSDYTLKNKQAYEVGRMLSAKPLEITASVKRLLEENASLKDELHKLKQRIFNNIAQKAPDNASGVCVLERDLESVEVRELCAAVDKKVDKNDGDYLSIIFSRCCDAYKYALISNNAKTITDAINQHFGGRGGGKDTFSQGSFPKPQNSTDAEEIEKFIKELHSGIIVVCE